MARHYRSDLWFIFYFRVGGGHYQPRERGFPSFHSEFHLKNRFIVDYNVQVDEFLVSSILKFQQWRLQLNGHSDKFQIFIDNSEGMIVLEGSYFPAIGVGVELLFVSVLACCFGQAGGCPVGSGGARFYLSVSLNGVILLPAVIYMALYALRNWLMWSSRIDLLDAVSTFTKLGPNFRLILWLWSLRFFLS